MSAITRRFQKSPDVVSQEIAGEMILVPIRQKVSDLESIYTLNETAARAWGLIDGQHTVEEIYHQILEEYDVDQEQARQDLCELFEKLEQIGAIVGE